MLQTFKESFLAEDYTKNLPDNLFDKAPVIIDFGANVGYFSLYMLMKYPAAKVFAYEPMPNNFELLKRNKAHNTELSFNIFNLAGYGNKTEIELLYDKSDTFTTSASVFENKIGNDKVMVKTTTIEELMQVNDLDKIDLIKLDCEGSEYSIVYNIPDHLFPHIKSFVLETHKGKKINETQAGMCDFLKNKGYKIVFDNSDMIWAWH